MRLNEALYCVKTTKNILVGKSLELWLLLLCNAEIEGWRLYIPFSENFKVYCIIFRKKAYNHSTALPEITEKKMFAIKN